MASFTTRVELHYASNDDYEKLHGFMEAEKFSRTIKADNGITYHLPTAEYIKEGDFTRKEVFDSAERAAKKTGKGYWILVTQSAGRTLLLGTTKK